MERGKYSALCISEDAEDGLCGGDVPEVAATAVFVQPEPVITPHERGAGADDSSSPSWNDTFFDNYPNVVAVFDYNINHRRRVQVDELASTITAFLALLVACLLLLFWNNVALAIPVIFFALPTASIIFKWTVVQPLVRMFGPADAVLPHTAVLESGIRHVEETSANHGSTSTTHTEIEIPWTDIVAVKVHRLLDSIANVELQVEPPTDRDAWSYTIHGFPQWDKVSSQSDHPASWHSSPQRYQKCFLGLQEPIQFQQFVLAHMTPRIEPNTSDKDT